MASQIDQDEHQTQSEGNCETNSDMRTIAAGLGCKIAPSAIYYREQMLAGKSQQEGEHAPTYQRCHFPEVAVVYRVCPSENTMTNCSVSNSPRTKYSSSD